MPVKNRKIKEVSIIIKYEDGYEEEGELEDSQCLVLSTYGGIGREKTLYAAKLQGISWNNNMRPINYGDNILYHLGIQEIKLELSGFVRILPKK